MISSKRLMLSAGLVAMAAVVACVGEAPTAPDGGVPRDGGKGFCNQAAQEGALACADFDGTPITAGLMLDCPMGNPVAVTMPAPPSAPSGISLGVQPFDAAAGVDKACQVGATLPTRKRRIVVDVDVLVDAAPMNAGIQFLSVTDGAFGVSLVATAMGWSLFVGKFPPGDAGAPKSQGFGALQSGVWTHLTLEVVRDAMAGSASLSIGGMPRAMVSGAMTAGPMAGDVGIRIGPRVFSVGGPTPEVKFAYDNVVVRAFD